MKYLVKTIKMKNYKPIDILQEGKYVHFNGNFSLPCSMKFGAPEEAKAFIKGVQWTVQYYDGEINNYMK